MSQVHTEARAPAPAIAVSGSDPRTAVDAFGALYAGRELYCRPSGEPFRFKYVGVGDEQVSARRLQLHGYLCGEISTENAVAVQWLAHGTARVDHGTRATTVEPGTLTLLPTQRPFRIEYENLDQRLVHVRNDLLRDVAAEQYLVGEQLLFTTDLPTDGAATERWRTSVAQAVAALRTEGPTSLAWHEAQRDIARALLRLYPLRAEPIPHRPVSRSSARFAAALEYLHSHADEPVTVADIADATGFSVRSVQETFQRNVQRSPMTYLREIRLDNARTQLQALDPAVTTVAEVAKRWGFNHMGRFSGEYQSRFGEYPRQTLRDRSLSTAASAASGSPTSYRAGNEGHKQSGDESS